MRLHLDTDFGGDIDDLCALAYLLRRTDVELLGVTTVLEAGGRRAGLVRRALEVGDRTEVPVAAGAPVSLGRFREREYGLPDDTRYWGGPVPAAPDDLGAALDLLSSSIEAGAAIVAIGPVTNLALLEERTPGSLALADVVMMGGHLAPSRPGYPKVDAEYDFNVQADVAASQRVFEAARTLTLVPPELTVRTMFRERDIAILDAGGDALARLIARQARAWSEDEKFGSRFSEAVSISTDLVNFQHDPLTAAVACGWEGVTVEPRRVEASIDAGLLRFRESTSDRAREVRVATRAQATPFGTHWLNVVTQRAPLDARVLPPQG